MRNPINESATNYGVFPRGGGGLPTGDYIAFSTFQLPRNGSCPEPPPERGASAPTQLWNHRQPPWGHTENEPLLGAAGSCVLTSGLFGLALRRVKGHSFLSSPPGFQDGDQDADAREINGSP